MLDKIKEGYKLFIRKEGVERIGTLTLNDEDIYKDIVELNDNDMEFATKVRGVLLDLEDYELISQVVKEETRQIFSIEKHICGLKQIYLKQLTINN